MIKTKTDWWCPTCKFTIWGYKPVCLKCGYVKPLETINVKPLEVQKVKPDCWEPGNTDPKWDEYGPFSYLKGGYSGKELPGEPPGLKYPLCGCNHLSNCPKRHHKNGCACYTCRGKSHKW